MTFELVEEMQLAFPDEAALAALFDLFEFTEADIEDFHKARTFMGKPPD